MLPSVPGSSCTKNQLSAWLAPPPPPPILTTGGSESAGIEGKRFSLPITSITVACISVPSVNSILIQAPPLNAFEDMTSMPGIPCNTSSMGSRISDSTSCGEAARQPAKTLICGRSISGKSCTGSPLRLNRPNKVIMATATATPAGFLTARSVMLIALYYSLRTYLFPNWTLQTQRTLPIHFPCREIRAFNPQLVVTKVMYCGDLLGVGGKPSQTGRSSVQQTPFIQ